MRKPTFHLVPPSSDEVREVLWRGRAALAIYLQEPDEHHPANTWLYLCTDHDYALEKLSGNMRREVGRGLKELTITPLTSEQVLAYGTQAFCETRGRLGLSDGTSKEFLPAFCCRGKLPGDRLSILYPSLRVKFAQGKREVVGDLPPRAFGEVAYGGGELANKQRPLLQFDYRK